MATRNLEYLKTLPLLAERPRQEGKGATGVWRALLNPDARKVCESINKYKPSVACPLSEAATPEDARVILEGIASRLPFANDDKVVEPADYTPGSVTSHAAAAPVSDAVLETARQLRSVLDRLDAELDGTSVQQPTLTEDGTVEPELYQLWRGRDTSRQYERFVVAIDADSGRVTLRNMKKSRNSTPMLLKSLHGGNAFVRYASPSERASLEAEVARLASIADDAAAQAPADPSPRAPLALVQPPPPPAVVQPPAAPEQPRQQQLPFQGVTPVKKKLPNSLN